MKTSLLMALSFACGAVVGATTMALFKKHNGRASVSENETKEDVQKTVEPLVIMHSEEGVCCEDPSPSNIAIGDTEKVNYKPKYDFKTEEYSALLKRYGGTSSDESVIGPYVISEEDLNENDDYGMVHLIYYADGVLSDELGVPVENVDLVVGEKFVNYFGSFGQPDIVCIRNDEMKCDYQIEKRLEKWSTVDSQNPHMKWR